MINSFEEINNYPEYPEQDVVKNFVEYVLDKSINESREITLEKLEILTDKQYHLYNEPCNDLKIKLKNWIILNWVNNTNDFLESILGIIRNFSLEKEFYKKALENYKGEDLDHKDFEKELINSVGIYMNPWWDLEKQKKK